MSSASVSLYIYGDDLDPVQIAKQIGASFDLSRKKGEKRELSSGRVVTQKTGVLSRYFETNSNEIARGVSELIREFDNIDRLDYLENVEEVKLDIFCAVNSSEIDGGDFKFVLTREVLDRISTLGASLSVTLAVVSEAQSGE
jgi:hypothetical protein